MKETVAGSSALNKFWSILKEAIRGSNRDFTEGSVSVAIFLLAVPMILEMVMESVFAVVDVYFVSSLGAESIAVVGITESLMVLIYGVAMGISIGVSAMVSRRIGENDSVGAARVVTHAIYFGIAASLLLGLIGFLFAPNLLRLIGASSTVIAQGTTFARIMFSANFVVIFLFLLNAVFRGAGDAAVAMRVLWIANILNCILDPAFIFGFWFLPEMGVTGAAIATTLGRGFGVSYALYYLFFKEQRMKIRAPDWKFDPKLFRRLISLSWVAMLQMIIATASWMGLMVVVSSFGSVAVAGYTIAIRVVVFALLPSVGLANAAATLVGQNLGAGHPDRAEKSVWKAALINACFLTLIGLLILIFANQIASVFTSDNGIRSIASDALRIISYGFCFYGIGLVIETSFNGAGDTLTPTYLNIFVFWMFEIPLAYILAHYTNAGIEGVFWAITIAFSLLTILSVTIFRRGNWKEKKV